MENRQATWCRLFPYIFIPILRDCNIHDPTFLCECDNYFLYHLFDFLSPRLHCRFLKNWTRTTTRFSTNYSESQRGLSTAPRKRLVFLQFMWCFSWTKYLAQDLTFLNRDLSKVVMLDTDPDHVSLQAENAIVIPKWKGNPRDKGLVAMIPFLECSSSFHLPQKLPTQACYS